MKEKLGIYAFLGGLLLATIIALIFGTNTPPAAVIAIGVLGLVVGIFNVKPKEEQKYLVAAIAFLISFQSLSLVIGSLALGWEAVASFFDLMSVFIAPAAALTALKAIYHISKD